MLQENIHIKQRHHAEFGMDPVPKNSKDMLWRDISRSAREGPDGRIKIS